MSRSIFSKMIKYKSSLNTFKYGTKLVQAFGFQPLRHEYAIFSFEFIKVCLRCLQEISVTGNMKLRLAIKFLIPYEWCSNALPPGQEKASNARGMPGGGMLKLQFDWYIIVCLSGIFRYLGICLTDLLFTWTCLHRPSIIVGTMNVRL